jgi:uncharacterized LabA/DUF88 family protein
MSKTSIFIDWSNIFVYAKNLGIKIDPLRLCNLVSNNESVIQRHYFSAQDPNNVGQQRFHNGLKQRGFLVHTHELVERPGKIYCPNCRIEVNYTCTNCDTPVTLPPHKSKRIDILIALKLLQTSHLYEEAILISGDQDFIPVIDHLRQEEGKKVTIASFREPLSYEYRASCDDLIILDDHIEEIKQIVEPRGGL